MREEKSPAFQFYPKDWLSDSKVISMNPEVRGLYIQLLCIDWLEDGFNGNQILRFSGYDYHDKFGNLRETEDFKQIEAELLECFINHPTKKHLITNPRLYKERTKQKERAIERAEAGRKGGLSTQKSRKTSSKLSLISASNQPEAKSTSSSSSSSSSSNNKYVREIFDHYTKTFNKNNQYKLSDARKNLIIKALKAHDQKSLIASINKMSTDDWPDRYKFNDLKYAIGTINGIDNVDKWASFETVKKKVHPMDQKVTNKQGETATEQARRWKQEKEAREGK